MRNLIILSAIVSVIFFSSFKRKNEYNLDTITVFEPQKILSKQAKTIVDVKKKIKICLESINRIDKYTSIFLEDGTSQTSKINFRDHYLVCTIYQNDKVLFKKKSIKKI